MVAELEATGTIVWLGEAGAEARDLVGGKVAPLSRLAAQYRVPPGFCLTTRAYEKGAGTLGGAALPEDLRQDISDAYRLLAARTGLDNPAVAVRSSAVDEDGAETSFAGQHDTYLNVTGVDAIYEAVARCWESARAPRQSARKRSGPPFPTSRISRWRNCSAARC